MVVAVSGGPDSVALFRALRALRPEGPLVVAHLNHLLRGEESDADEAFVRGLAGPASGVAFRSDRVDVAARASAEGGNFEQVARRVRYDWLVRVAQQTGARFVATGHTADDQAETVLHRLLRGCGLKGLRGIAARRPLGEGVEAVRPLLRVRRAEVLTYLAAEGQPFRHDRSNADLSLTRNRIRLELLPHLAERYNPAVIEVLCRLAEQAGEAFQEEEARAEALLAAVERPRAGTLLILDRQGLAVQPRNLVREVFRLIWTREGWPAGGMGYEDWDCLAAIVCAEAAAVDLPGGIRATGGERVVQLGRAP
jgi:tRNA(Ile)-lysidine synthase